MGECSKPLAAHWPNSNRVLQVWSLPKKAFSTLWTGKSTFSPRLWNLGKDGAFSFYLTTRFS